MPRPVFTHVLRLRYLFAGLLLVFAFWQWHVLTGARVASNVSHVDERGWMASGLAYCGLLYGGDFAPAHWEIPSLGPFGNLNPHLGKIMLCTPAYFTAKDARLRYVPQERLKPSDTEGLCSKGVPRPPLKIYRASRNAAKFWAGLTAVTLAATVCWLFGSWAGGIFALTLLLNRTFRVNSAFALTDMPYLFTLNVAFVGGILLLRARSRGGLLGAAGLLGVGAGLATSVKVTAMVTVSLYVMLLLGVLVYIGQARLRRAVGGFALYLGAALFVVVALNPFCWPDFEAVDLAAASEELALIRDPAAAGVVWNEEGSLWKSLTEVEIGNSVVRAKAPSLRAMLRPLEYPLLYPRWSRLFEMLAERWPRRSTWSIVQESLAGHASSLFEVALFLLGFGVTARAAWARLRGGTASPEVAVLVYTGVQLVFLVFALPVGGMDRYLLPFLVVSKVFVAVGMIAALGPPRQLVADLRRARQARGMTSTSAL